MLREPSKPIADGQHITLVTPFVFMFNSSADISEAARRQGQPLKGKMESVSPNRHGRVEAT